MFYAVIFFATIVLLFLLSGVRKPAKFPPGNFNVIFIVQVFVT